MSTTECARCERPVGDNLPLCSTCGDHIATEQLLDVPRLATELIVTQAGLGRVAAPTAGGRSAETPIPVRVNGGDSRGVRVQGDRELRRATAAIMDWARQVATKLGTTIPFGAPGLVQICHNLRHGPDHREPIAPALRRDPETGKFIGHVPSLYPVLLSAPVTDVEQAAVWLAHHPHDIRATEQPGDPADAFHNRVIAALDGIRRIIDRPVDRRYLGACPATLEDGAPCGYELRAQVDDTGRVADFVECRRCRTQHDVARIEAAARDRAEGQAYTLAEIARLTKALGAPIPKQSLHHWAHKSRRLQPRGWQHIDDRYGVRITDHQIGPDDKQVYRLGDALELARLAAKYPHRKRSAETDPEA